MTPPTSFTVKINKELWAAVSHAVHEVYENGGHPDAILLTVLRTLRKASQP